MDSVRIDRWLWAARFFKTRSMSADAVKGGKVHLNGNRIKASKLIQVGDSLEITREQTQWVIDIIEIRDKRVSATLASLMYNETETSKENRETQQAMRKFEYQGMQPAKKRPSSRQRGKIRRFIRGQE